MPLVLIGASRSVLFTLAALAIIGVGVSLVDISAITILQRTVPDAVLGRALGSVDAILHGALGIGALLAPALIYLVGLRSTLIATGMTAAHANPCIREHPFALSIAGRPQTSCARRRCYERFDILGALPEATLERLALSLQQVRASPPAAS